MKPPRLTLLVVAMVALATAACSHTTLESRIQEKKTTFARITPREQAMIKQGIIGHGFTPDMVYMALDRPDRVIPGPGPHQETWLYIIYYPTDGSNTHIPRKITTHEEGEGPLSGHMPGVISGKTPLYRLEFTVDYDPNDTRAPIEEHTRVAVMFRFGRVASIQVDKV